MTRLLLVDNDNIARAALGVACSDAGYEVRQADNGSEALKIHRETPVHVIITEMLLPEMDGIELLMALRRQPSAPKVIAMTAGGHFAIEHCLRVAEQLGAHHVLAKPFEPEQLLAAVRSVLGKN
jgi:DNA-binding response OmpR family regulator